LNHATPPPQRNAHVDQLRGVAILCVLILHFTLAYGLKNSPLGTLLPDWLLRAAFQGNFGVTMFFTVSGYLITSMSLQRWGALAHIELRTFYLYRFARIMPSLALALAIIVALGALDLPFFSNSDGDKHLPASYFLVAAGSVLTFWHNVLMQSAGYFNYCLNVYWSLSVEEMFYLLMPLCCLLLRRDGLIVLLCCAAIVAGPCYRSLHIDDEIFFMYGYQACFDAIAIGCLCALLAHRLVRGGTRALAHGRWLRLVSAVALAALYLRGIRGHEVFGFSLVSLASAGYLLGAHCGPAAPAVDAHIGPVSWPGVALRWFGRHSYEIYLFHIIVLALMRNLVDQQQLGYAARLPWLLLFLALTALVAAGVARRVAEPANAALRRRFARPMPPSAPKAHKRYTL
jgi:peptidoglycan/LPS O-acetylase OafA/YrhL